MRYLIILISMLLMAEQPKATVEQLFSVQTVKVKKASSSKKQKNYGYVKADESLTYSVTPRFGGYIEILYADTIYKYVKEGELLARVYSPEVLSAKEEYLASLKYNKIRKSAEMLESSKEKLVLLHINAKEIQEIENTLKVSKYTNIYAPKSGYIFQKSISNLDAFKAGQKLFEIVNLESVWVEARIFQKELANLKNLDNFKVKAIGIDIVFDAKKDILYPSLDEKEATFTLRLQVKNKNNLLKNGMYVSVESSYDEGEYLILPTTAVIRKNGFFYAFVAGEYEGEYEPTKVEVKVLDSSNYMIESGLEVGTEVINNALFMMDSDAQINGTY